MVSQILVWQCHALAHFATITTALVANNLGQSLLSLALLFLLVTAPDFGTLDPVLVSRQPLNGGQFINEAVGQFCQIIVENPAKSA